MATDLGLGTCWLGGTFSSSRFAQKIALQNNEALPAVTPVGYAVPRISAIDSVIRSASGANNRTPWNSLFFNKDDKPLSVVQASRYSTPLEMVRLAPSATNFQPWRIIKASEPDMFHFCIKRAPGLKQLFSMKSDLQRIDIGIAMCHFELAAEEEGLKGNGSYGKAKTGIPSVHWAFALNNREVWIELEIKAKRGDYRIKTVMPFSLDDVRSGKSNTVESWAERMVLFIQVLSPFLPWKDHHKEIISTYYDFFSRTTNYDPIGRNL
ncbi:MAG: nitroreductase family protein [Smithella sp.]